MIGNYNYGTGRRKSSVARVFIKRGKGEILINGRPIDTYFQRETGRMIARQPLELTNHKDTFDVLVNVHGGGESGQAGAVRHGITRALIDYDATSKPVLSSAGQGRTSTAAVELFVQSPRNLDPVAVADSLAISESGVHDSGSLLANDSDPDALPGEPPLQELAGIESSGDSLAGPYRLQTTRAITLAIRQVKGVLISSFRQDIDQALLSLRDMLPDDLRVERTSDEPAIIREKIRDFDRMTAQLELPEGEFAIADIPPGSPEPLVHALAPDLPEEPATVSFIEEARAAAAVERDEPLIAEEAPAGNVIPLKAR